MRILPSLLAKIPNLKVLIGGRDRSAYGPKAPNNDGSWKTLVLNELGEFIGKERIVFTGLMNYGEYRKLLYRTNLHFYFTRPYVTSWSLFEAVACGTPVFTNSSEATNGTIEINNDFLISEISDLSQEGTIERLVDLICQENLAPRISTLDQSFNLDNCLQQWNKLVNNTLAKK